MMWRDVTLGLHNQRLGLGLTLGSHPSLSRQLLTFVEPWVRAGGFSNLRMAIGWKHQTRSRRNQTEDDPQYVHPFRKVGVGADRPRAWEESALRNVLQTYQLFDQMILQPFVGGHKWCRIAAYMRIHPPTDILIPYYHYY